MTTAMMMERTGMMPGMNPMMSGTMGGTATMPTTPQHDDGAPLHHEDGEVHRRHEDHLHLRRRDVGRHDAEPVHHDGRRHVQLLLMMNGMMVCCCNLTMGMCKCEMTKDGVLHHLHQRRQRVLRDDPGLLRLHDGHDEGRLHLLHDDEQHAGLLLLLKSPSHRAVTSCSL